MTNPSWNIEIQRFLGAAGHSRQKWLVDLLYALTVFARDTYTVGGTGVDSPERLRRFNELMHRAAGKLRDELVGCSGMPDDLFVRMIMAEADSLGLSAKEFGKVVS